MKEKIPFQTLREFSLFQDLSEDDLIEIEKKLHRRMVTKDEILLFEGEILQKLIFVETGWFKSEKTSKKGRQQTLRFIGPMEVINEYAVFSEEPSEATIIALENAKVFYLQEEDVESLLNRSPRFSRAVISNLAKRIRHLINHVENLSLLSVEQRLAQYLLEEEQAGLIIRQSWKTQAEIAAQLGTVVDVINRSLQKFERRGIIEITREQFTILDKDRLREIIDKSA
jgi:CRP/FNR family transcriptional regulator